MGLSNTPETLMRTTNNLFRDLLDNGSVVFLDDVLIMEEIQMNIWLYLEKYLHF